MDWWIWAAVGLTLAGIELFTPGGFFVIFFGAGALVTGLVLALTPLAAAWQWMLFTAVSVISLLVFRKPLLERMRASQRATPPVDALTSDIAVASENIAPHAIGQVELRGASWKARNAGPDTVTKGQRCRVDRVDGLVLWIRAEGTES